MVTATYIVRGKESLTIHHENELIELMPSVAVTRAVTPQVERVVETAGS